MEGDDNTTPDDEFPAGWDNGLPTYNSCFNCEVLDAGEGGYGLFPDIDLLYNEFPGGFLRCEAMRLCLALSHV